MHLLQKGPPLRPLAACLGERAAAAVELSSVGGPQYRARWQAWPARGERKTTPWRSLLGRWAAAGSSITTVGFGAWAIGGGGWSFGWGPQDDDASIAAIRHAARAGMNWIDTAAVYGLGHSEEVVGRALRDLPPADRPLCLHQVRPGLGRARPHGAAARMLHPDSIRRECEASLRRLGVERIDLYQFHWPDETGTAVEDSWAAMARLVEEGKVRAIGVSNFDVALLERCEAVRHVDSLQPPFSLDPPRRRRRPRSPGAPPTAPGSSSTARCSRAF